MFITGAVCERPVYSIGCKAECCWDWRVTGAVRQIRDTDVCSGSLIFALRTRIVLSDAGGFLHVMASHSGIIKAALETNSLSAIPEDRCRYSIDRACTLSLVTLPGNGLPSSKGSWVRLDGAYSTKTNAKNSIAAPLAVHSQAMTGVLVRAFGDLAADREYTEASLEVKPACPRLPACSAPCPGTSAADRRN